MKSIYIIFLIYINSICFAQSREVSQFYERTNFRIDSLIKCGNKEAAIVLLTDGISHFQNTSNEDFRQTAYYLEVLGDLFVLTDRPDSLAILNYQRSVDKKMGFPNYFTVKNIGNTYRKLACLYLKREKYSAAKALFAYILDYWKKWGVNDTSMARVKCDCADVYCRLYRDSMETAKKLYFSAIQIYKKYPNNDNLLWRPYKGFAEMYDDGDSTLNVSKMFYRESLSILKRNKDANACEIARESKALADLYNYLAQYEAAEPFYRESLEFHLKCPDSSYNDIRDVMDSLKMLYSPERLDDKEKQKQLLLEENRISVQRQ
jgi:hypothetical protein